MPENLGGIKFLTHTIGFDILADSLSLLGKQTVRRMFRLTQPGSSQGAKSDADSCLARFDFNADLTGTVGVDRSEQSQSDYFDMIVEDVDADVEVLTPASVISC